MRMACGVSPTLPSLLAELTEPVAFAAGAAFGQLVGAGRGLEIVGIERPFVGAVVEPDHAAAFGTVRRLCSVFPLIGHLFS